MRRMRTIGSGARRKVAPITPPTGRRITSASGAEAGQKGYRIVGAGSHAVYGISREQYETLLASRAACAAICGKPPQEPLCCRSFPRDGRVRGLLCRKCNTALGSFDDDVSVMAAGIAYLRKAAADDAAPRRRPPEPRHRNNPEVCSATRAFGARCAALHGTQSLVSRLACRDGEHPRQRRPDNPFRCVRPLRPEASAGGLCFAPDIAWRSGPPAQFARPPGATGGEHDERRCAARRRQCQQADARRR